MSHDVEGTGNALPDLESKVNSRSNAKVNYVFSFNASPPKPLYVATLNFAGALATRCREHRKRFM